MRVSLSLNLLTATVLAIVAGSYAIFSIQISGIYSSNQTDANLIRERCPIRLIQPEWVSNQPDTLMNWCVTEIRARLGLILALWLIGVTILVWRYLKKRNAAGNVHVESDADHASE